MLSNPLHRYPPYHHGAPAPPYNMHMNQAQISTNHNVNPHQNHNAFETFRPEATYGFQQLEQGMPGASPPMISPGSHPHQHQHQSTAPNRSSVSGPVRRRISRACDQCNQLRTKCDGQHPCAHCVGTCKPRPEEVRFPDFTNPLSLELNLGCEYMRQKKKRGKASRKDLAARVAAQSEGPVSPNGDSGNSQAATERLDASASISRGADGSPRPSNDEMIDARSDGGFQRRRTNASSDISDQSHPVGDTHMDRGSMGDAQPMDLHDYGRLHAGYDRHGTSGNAMVASSAYSNDHSNMPGYPGLPFGLLPQSPASYNNGPSFRVGHSSMDGYPMAGRASPGWGMPMSSTSPGQYQTQVPHHQSFNRANLRYPVLEPLLPYMEGIIPIPLACDLMDLYFSSSSSAQMHPMSPYVLGFVFRKKAFLHPTQPRKCQPALLASMLWVAAQTSDAPLLSSSPSARTKICQRLLELTVRLLKPLIHTPMGESYSTSNVGMGAVGLGGLGIASSGSVSMDALTGEYGAFGAAGHFDDVATYAHLATVVSASEYKGASLRWWNAAWSLARELKLGRELPPNEPRPSHANNEADHPGLDEHDTCRNSSGFVTEEEREERRRIWWLVYIADRHLALCYNRPLFLLDVECTGLLQPMNDTAWQKGEFKSCFDGNPDALRPVSQDLGAQNHGVRGPQFECRGHSIFGYFLPLMTLLGEIVDLHHAKSHPRFGLDFRGVNEWDGQTAEIRRHLDVYEQSLKRFEERYLAKPTDEMLKGDSVGSGTAEIGMDPSSPSTHSVYTNASSRMMESEIQSRIVLAYSTHVLHVLHILLAGKWDPIELLDHNDVWISSPEFITSTSHAVSAAEAINQILEYDPGLEFMPFFFGAYLLQGSFLLLLIADKLQYDASPSVVKACETIVRAHEACVVTLFTEYQVSCHVSLCLLSRANVSTQRNFSKVMRSALAVVRGRNPEDLGEQHLRRRELLSLYRWTGDGTGLAL